RGYVDGLVEVLIDSSSDPTHNFAAYSPASQHGRISNFAKKGLKVNSLSTLHMGLLPHKYLVYGNKFCGADKMTIVCSMLGADGHRTMLVFSAAAKALAMDKLGYKPDLMLGYCASEPVCGAKEQMYRYKSDKWNSDVFAWTSEAKKKYESMGHFHLVQKLPCYMFDTKETCSA
ncbi:hypothetical protein PFISCL1PPCAC_8669, partial [Pristionchus fissidentatus]